MACFIITSKQCRLLVLLSLTLLIWQGDKGTAAQSVATVTNVRVTNETNSTVTLSWDAPPEIGNYTYNIKVSPDTGSSREYTADISPFVVMGLEAGVTYEFSITTNSSGNLSSPVSTKGTTRPNIVSGFKVKDQTTSSVLLSWTVPTDPNNANYTYNISVSPSDVSTVSTTKNANEVNITNLKPGVTYTFTITTLTQNLIPSTGNPSTEATTNPSAVSNVTVISRTTSTVTLSWSAPNNTNTATYSYIIIVSNGTSSWNISTNQSVTSKQVDNLLPGVNYTFSVRTQTVNNVLSSPSESIIGTTSPSRVSGFNVKAQTTSSVLLSWTAPTDQNRATYTYDISVSPPDVTAARTPQNANEFNITNLKPGVTYTFTITTLTQNLIPSTGNPSTEATTNPSAVSNVTVISRTTNTVTLSWSAPNNTNTATYSYIIIVSNGTSSWNISTNQSVTSKQVDNLLPGVNYTFSVRTQTVNNVLSSPSESIIGTTSPSIVSGLNVKAQTTSSVLLSWTAPTDQNRATYTYDISVSPPDVTAVRTPQNANEFNVTNLKPGVTYTFTITTLTQNLIPSTGNPSTEATTNPSAVSNVTVISRTTSTVTLSWSAPNNTNTATYSYIIIVSNGTSPWNISTNQSVTSKQVDNLLPGVNYTFSVRTQTVNNVLSSPSESIIGTTSPSRVSGFNVKAQTTSSVLLSWTAPTDQNRATYTYDISVSPPDVTAARTPQNANEFNITNLKPGVTYTFTITTLTQNLIPSTGNPSTEATTNPSAVSNVTVISRTTNTVTLSWSAPNNTNTATYSYIIIVSNDTSPWNISTNQSVTSKQVDNLLPGVNYTFSVRTQTVNNVFSSPSEYVVGTTIPSAVTGLELVGRTNSSITIKWTTPNDVRVLLYKYKINIVTLPGKTITIAGNSYTATSLNPGSQYTFEVQSEIDNWNSASAVFAAYSVPNQPADITGNPISTSSVAVTWVAPNDPNKDKYEYKVTWSESNGSNQNTQTTSKTNTSIPNLYPGYAYNVTVRSVISDAFSATAQTWLQTNPLKPTDITISNITNSSVIVSWKASSDTNSALSGFQITAFFEGGTPTVLNVENPKTDQYELKDLIPGNFYTFQLRSYKINEFLATSSRIQRRALPPTPVITYSDTIEKKERMFPDAARIVQCTKVGGGYSLKVDIMCPTGYFSQIQILVNGQSIPVTNCTSPETVSVTVTSLQPASGYNIKVTTFADTRESPSVSTTCHTDDVGVIVGAIVGVLLFLLLVGLIAFFILKKRRTKRPDAPIPFGNEKKRYHSISKERFPVYFQTQHADSDFGFAEEYQELSSAGTKQAKNAAEMPDNRGKNRFTNVLPYDHSRVKLSCVDDNPCTDYINANYMPGYNSTKEYIASQGPLPNTTADFWRMVWEHHISTIVMLTNCVENGRVKCEHYWPLDYTPCTYGDITVTVSSETILPEWTIRDFSLKHAHQDGIKYVHHFHFTAWPDHGVPENTSSIIHFRNLVREHMDQQRSRGPTVVHCSAGVGRTGTLIALDYLIQQMEREHRVGVYSFVEKMRLNRPLMVQTESQYVFLNKCMMSLIQQPIEENIYENQMTDLIYENASVVRNFQRENA